MSGIIKNNPTCTQSVKYCSMCKDTSFQVIEKGEVKNKCIRCSQEYI